MPWAAELWAPAAVVAAAAIAAASGLKQQRNTMRRDEDEERGRRLDELQERVAELMDAREADQARAQAVLEQTMRARDEAFASRDDERARRTRCEVAIYALRTNFLVMRGALERAGITIPPVAEIPYPDTSGGPNAAAT